MSYTTLQSVMCSVVLFCVTVSGIAADDTTRPSTANAPGNPPVRQVDLAAEEAYKKLVAAYMNSDFNGFDELLRKASATQFKLTPDHRKDISYIRGVYKDVRPDWWSNTKSTRNVSFPMALWGKKGIANFEPGDALGESQPIKIVNNQLIAVVRWRPQYVDSDKAVKGLLGEKLGVSEGDFAETIIWHELGHTYVTAWIPPEMTFELYTKSRDLFFHLQEFYADMTAIRHASPKSRLLTMMFRLDEIDPPFEIAYRNKEAHTRAAHAIGSLLLNEFLINPNKWPNVHFPPEVPSGDAERKAITYVYEHFDKNWSLDEDQNLREFAQKYLAASGLRILQSHGAVPLREGQVFSLLYTDDTKQRTRRDAWVAEKLKKIIDSGRADKKSTTDKKAQPNIKGVVKVGQYRNPYRFMLPIE